MEEQGDFAVWMSSTTSLSGFSAELRQFQMERQLAQHVTHPKNVAGKDFDPVKACIGYEAQPHASLYEAFLGCPCSPFGPYQQFAKFGLDMARAHRLAAAGNLDSGSAPPHQLPEQPRGHNLIDRANVETTITNPELGDR
ncbi:hypothetical protein [Cupriavidus sp. D39]|uniref:hypothetical protein n=1 Tax=Cupriavidus sp. D39 TaxID=2997877 RepID=UPI0022707DE5|nr:hypothetical protein [Cupriavidus sp. D39]